MVTEITTIEKLLEIFKNNENGLTIIDFYAEWCGPCKIFSPKYDQLSEKYTQVSFCKINVDEPHLEEFVMTCNIECMPTFCFFLGGSKVATVKGANQNEIEKLIVEILSKMR